jgi:CheY-like chemotaxis protein
MGVTEASRALEPMTSVLVVEDDFLLRESTADTLNDLGYRAISACDAGQALAALDLFPEIAILLADIGLPVMNGLELTAEARRRRPGLAVLFVTGYARPGRIGAVAPGDICLLKPYTPADLAKALRQSLEAAPLPAGASAAAEIRPVVTQP